MEKSPAHYYEQQIEALTVSLKELQKKSVRTGLLRLIDGLAILVCIYNLFRTSGESSWWVITGVLAIIFIILVRRSTALKSLQQYQQAHKKINKEELDGLQGNFEAFDAGEDLLSPGHPFGFDLDLFGEKSLFQRINRSVTIQGRSSLASQLADPEQDADKTNAIQEMLREMQSLPDWRQQFLTLGTISPEEITDRTSIENWLSLPSTLSQDKKWGIILTVLPIITIGCWVLFLFGVLPIWTGILMSLILLGITGNKGTFINERHQLINKKSAILKKYYTLVCLFTDQAFEAPALKKMQEKLSVAEYPAASFDRFLKLVNALDNRLNMLMALILNALLLWDLNCLIRIEKWNLRFRHHFPIWMDIIGQLDGFISMAGYNFNHPDHTTPSVLNKVDNNGFLLEMEDGTHPLLFPEPSVPNSLIQSDALNLFLITGANMAGKSTFLRTVGLNMVLAMAGANTATKSMKLTPVQLCTSMRTNDSLMKHTSFFYAELKKLKWIMDKIKAKEPVYILLDEILKGTNSKDQHLGSAALIKNIIHHHGRGLIATHDLELTELATEYPEHIKNIAFEIDMEGDKMVFSYQYKDGVCQNMNASMLMKQMGIT